MPDLALSSARAYSKALMTRSTPPAALSQRHLLGIEGLSPLDITALLDAAEGYLSPGSSCPVRSDSLRGHGLITAFFEESTRTRTSFELAGKRLGADVVNLSVAASSVSKGETLRDTVATLDSMHPAFLAIRHPHSGVLNDLVPRVRAALINAGDGCHEHPTQALLDALTIRRRKGRIVGLTVAICGDIAHSRVARSNILLLTTLGARVRVIGPPTLMPAGIDRTGVEIFHDMTAGLGECDIVMMLRLQRERMNGSLLPSLREYFRFFGLDQDKLARARNDALVMHPGPINRGVEIASAIADDPARSLIGEQVETGIAVRMACLEALAAARRASDAGKTVIDTTAAEKRP